MTITSDEEIERALREALVRLIDATPDASTLREVAQLRGKTAIQLLSDESGVDYWTVARVTKIPFEGSPGK